MRPLKQAIYSSRTADKFVVRLPDGMRERIAEVARNHHRSMNSEIIARLEQSLVIEADRAPDALPSHAQDLVRALDIQPWVPRVGDLVKRRDTGRVLGSITGFEISKLGVMAVLSQFEGDPQGRQALGLLEPMDISEVIEGSGGPILRALEKVYEGKKDGLI